MALGKQACKTVNFAYRGSNPGPATTFQNGPVLDGFGSGRIRQMRPEAAPGIVHYRPAGPTSSLAVSAGSACELVSLIDQLLGPLE